MFTDTSIALSLYMLQAKCVMYAVYRIPRQCIECLLVFARYSVDYLGIV
jgi:hypothetical protein